MSPSELGSEISSIDALERHMQRKYLQIHLLSFTKAAANEAVNYDE